MRIYEDASTVSVGVSNSIIVGNVQLLLATGIKRWNGHQRSHRSRRSALDYRMTEVCRSVSELQSINLTVVALYFSCHGSMTDKITI